jgi:hypothetical protein
VLLPDSPPKLGCWLSGDAAQLIVIQLWSSFSCGLGVLRSDRRQFMVLSVPETHFLLSTQHVFLELFSILAPKQYMRPEEK